MGLKRLGLGAQPALDDRSHEVEPAAGRVVLVAQADVGGARRQAKPTVHAWHEPVFLRPERGGQRGFVLRIH